MKKTTIIIFILVLFSAFFVIPNSTALADCEESGILPPCTCSGRCGLNDFLSLGSRLVQYAIGLISIITLGLIINAGFTMLMSFGNPEKLEAGKKMMGGTLRGVGIVLLAWALVNTIIFFLTGNASGLIFGEGEGWWKFKETKEIKETLYMGGDMPGFRPDDCDSSGACTVNYLPLNERSEFCYYRRETTPHTYRVHPQVCTDTKDLDALEKGEKYCVSLGNCNGDKDVICCDMPIPPIIIRRE